VADTCGRKIGECAGESGQWQSPGKSKVWREFDEWESKLGDPRSSRPRRADVFLEAMFSTESMLMDPARRCHGGVDTTT
jgi:hypothetical protein